MSETLTSSALTTRSVPMPTNPAVAAVACKVVHFLVRVLASLISAKPNSTPLKLRPVAPLLSTPSVYPPPMPAKALRPVPPMVSTLTVIPVVASLTAVPAMSLASLTVWLLLLRAMLPVSATNPNTFTLSTPLALSCSPWPPSRSSARLLPVPVATVSSVLLAPV